MYATVQCTLLVWKIQYSIIRRKNALYKRHGSNYGKILLYQYVEINCEIITEKYAEINKKQPTKQKA